MLFYSKWDTIITSIRKGETKISINKKRERKIQKFAPTEKLKCEYYCIYRSNSKLNYTSLMKNFKTIEFYFGVNASIPTLVLLDSQRVRITI